MDCDVINGDADGLCALLQLRLAEPRAAALITGVKRDIRLLERVPPGARRVTVCDLSLAENRVALEALLATGAEVEYFDHHFAGTPLQHPQLHTHFDPAPTVCSALLVDRHLGGRHRAWAVVGAFGDNLVAEAQAAADSLGLDATAVQALRSLGECLNYNAYGDSVADLHFDPAALWPVLLAAREPLAFVAGAPEFVRLRDGYSEDMARADALVAEWSETTHALYRLPDAAWARRVSGVLGNRLAREAPQRAHALLSPRPGGGFVVSVRAPQRRPQGADALCRQFASGGGRAGAAGINHLPEDALARFAAAFRAAFRD